MGPLGTILNDVITFCWIQNSCWIPHTLYRMYSNLILGYSTKAHTSNLGKRSERKRRREREEENEKKEDDRVVG